LNLIAFPIPKELSMLPQINLKMIASALLIVLLAGTTVAPAHAQKGFGGDGDSKAEVAKLRDEVARLRGELDAALKDIRDLKEALAGKLPARSDESQLYRGKPARFWLEQLKDADGNTRVGAVDAIGALAKKNKTLSAALIDVVKNESVPSIAASAAAHLSSLGPAVLPPLMEIANDKTKKWPRWHAINAIGGMGADAKPAVPILIQALKETDDPGLSRATVSAVMQIGPGAREAIPALVDTLDMYLRDIDKKDASKSRFRFGGSDVSNVFEAVKRLDPAAREIMPKNYEIGWGGDGRLTGQSLHRSQQALDALRKRYPASK
jgi:hypothetical protein